MNKHIIGFLIFLFMITTLISLSDSKANDAQFQFRLLFGIYMLVGIRSIS